MFVLLICFRKKGLSQAEQIRLSDQNLFQSKYKPANYFLLSSKSPRKRDTEGILLATRLLLSACGRSTKCWEQMWYRGTAGGIAITPSVNVALGSFWKQARSASFWTQAAHGFFCYMVSLTFVLVVAYCWCIVKMFRHSCRRPQGLWWSQSSSLVVTKPH